MNNKKLKFNKQRNYNQNWLKKAEKKILIKSKQIKMIYQIMINMN